MRNNKLMKFRQDGQVLIVVVLVSSVLLMIVLSFLAMVTREIVIQRGLSDSIMAYYAAETGVEEAVYNVKTNLSNPGAAGVPSGCGPFTIDSPAQTATITCTGNKNGTLRAIKATINTDTTQTVIRPIKMQEVSP